MTTIKTVSTTAFASLCTFAILTGASQARTVPHRIDGPAITGAILPPPQSADWLGGRDTDSSNVQNPALPDYAQSRGQETGGPARELILN
ncbi:hypothetical protein [Methylobacterium sp. Leaf118]|uniref:hypothetical protein n=1 Tax=Methylobacterium sp. Leaf118 TaxID=2876562 RepID=UPI001E3F311A|nr:hypothetical protein [Methylobacterium sp. Leaf118]